VCVVLLGVAGIRFEDIEAYIKHRTQKVGAHKPRSLHLYKLKLQITMMLLVNIINVAISKRPKILHYRTSHSFYKKYKDLN